MPIYNTGGGSSGCCCGAGGGVPSTGVEECPDSTFCNTCPNYHMNIDETEFGDCDECWLQQRSGGFDFNLQAGCFWQNTDGGPSDPNNQGDCCDVGLENDATASLDCVYLVGDAGSAPDYNHLDQSLFSEGAGNALPDGTYWVLTMGASARTLDASSSLCVDGPLPGTAPAAGDGFAWAESYTLVESGVCPQAGDWPIHNQATNNGCDGLTKLILTEQ
jgi:hypothetical protein